MLDRIYLYELCCFYELFMVLANDTTYVYNYLLNQRVGRTNLNSYVAESHITLRSNIYLLYYLLAYD